MESWLVGRDLSGKARNGEGIKGSWSRFISRPAVSGFISQTGGSGHAGGAWETAREGSQQCSGTSRTTHSEISRISRR